MENRDLCMRRLKTLLDGLSRAKDHDRKTYYSCKAEAFLEALYYCDVVDDTQYSALMEKIDNLMNN